ncbi:MAG: hypothetical protein OEX22_00890 [Cyclobacteriaceae bacterium]|nr:hypothetical protein [Cyclobacteriaceae bacterium]
MKKILLLLFPVIVNAQVINDNIANRISLALNEEVISNTANCTVEKACVDELLTGKCIKYHNDQWFSFQSEKEQKIYVNIYGQKCRDLRGVQLVVIDGTPCEVSDYTILSCVSLASQDNFYIELDLEKEKEYLLNVDGYLHDHCNFFISIDTTSYGFPTYADFPLETDIIKNEKEITLKWKIPDSLSTQIKHFEVHRRKNKEYRHEYINSIPIELNSFGSSKEKYMYIDTISQYRRLHYKLIAVDINDKFRLISEFEF